MDPFRMDDHVALPLSQDAALVTALAGTAMAFAHSREDEAERWLRALRLHGTVGRALQALGVGEAPLATTSEPARETFPDIEGDPVRRSLCRAGELAVQRGAESVTTVDLLFALFDVYDRRMERALYIRGASRAELSERLIEQADHARAVKRE
jgi:hypothetical protein